MSKKNKKNKKAKKQMLKKVFMYTVSVLTLVVVVIAFTARRNVSSLLAKPEAEVVVEEQTIVEEPTCDTTVVATPCDSLQVAPSEEPAAVEPVVAE